MINKIVCVFIGLLILFPVVISEQPYENIVTDYSHHHIGDDFKEDLVPNEPEGTVYTMTFFLDSEFDSPELSFMMKSVVPVDWELIDDSTEYLNKVYINDVEVDILNIWVMPQESEATDEFHAYLEPELLSIGSNTIKITSGSNREKSNYDDFEFFDLELKGLRKTGWILSGWITEKGEPVNYACIDVYRYGTDELVSSFFLDDNGFYSVKLSNGIYGVKAWHSDNLYGGAASDIEKVEINNSNISLDLEMSGHGLVDLLLIISVIFFLFVGLIIAISVYIFTKKIKLSVIGFVLGTIAAYIALVLIF